MEHAHRGNVVTLSAVSLGGAAARSDSCLSPLLPARATVECILCSLGTEAVLGEQGAHQNTAVPHVGPIQGAGWYGNASASPVSSTTRICYCRP